MASKKIKLSFISLFLSNLLIAQVPQISSFSPEAGPTGTTITITGSNFSTTTDNIVYFGAVKALVSASSNTSLTVTVPSGATFQPISVTTNGLTAYSSKPFIVTFTGGNIPEVFSRTDFVTGVLESVQPKNTCIADLDEDGMPDLIANNFYAHTLSIFRNTSSNQQGAPKSVSLDTRVDYATDANPSNITAGDIDGDGKLDLVVPAFGDGSISILRNTSTIGNISFASKVKYYTGTSPRNAAVVDIDGDGKLDIAVVNEHSATISIFRNTSVAGTVSLAPKVSVYTYSNPRDLRVADINGDGKADLVCANFGSGTVKIYLNTSSAGNVSFNEFYTISTGGSPRSTAVADFDGDGKVDIAVANYSSSEVAFYRNTTSLGEVSFSLGSSVSTISNAYGITAGDLDGDGKTDVAIGNNTTTGGATILKNLSTLGTIQFGAKTIYETGPGTTFVSICDLNADSHPELVASNYFSKTVSILTKENALPLHLTSFKGKWNERSVELMWTTEEEKNSQYFIVERSFGGPYNTIGRVNANGLGAYSFKDEVLKERIGYYRLKIFDKDGSSVYSEVVPITLAFKDFKKISVYPNPTKSTITIENTDSDNLTISLYNLEGKLITKSSVMHMQKKTQIDLSSYPIGVYSLVWSDGRDFNIEKIIKE